MQILVFQHADVEHPGVFRDFWAEAGHRWTSVELDAGEPIPPLDGFDLLVVMGGPMDVWQEDVHPWLKPEQAAIRRWVEELCRPYLGICLGHQLLAAALGGTVGLMRAPEVGLADVVLTADGRDDPLLAGFDATIETFQWHGAAVTRLPAGARTLAGNAASPVQAMRCGRFAYGFQYHCEITATTVSEWARIPEYRASLEEALGIAEAARLEGVVQARLPAFRAAARRLDDNLMALIAGAASVPG